MWWDYYAWKSNQKQEDEPYISDGALAQDIFTVTQDLKEARAALAAQKKREQAGGK